MASSTLPWCPLFCSLPGHLSTWDVVSSRFLVLPMLGRSLQSILDDSPKHIMPTQSVFQMAYRLVRTRGCPPSAG